MTRARGIRRKSVLRDFLSRLAGRFGFRLYNMYYGERDLTDPIPDKRPAVDVEINEASQADLHQIIGMLDHHDARLFQNCRDIGSTCLVAKSNHRIAGYTWINTRLLVIDELTICELPDHVGLSHGSYVFSEFRSKGIYRCLVRAAHMELASQGRRCVGSLMDKANAPAMRARRNLGYRHQSAWVLKLPGLRTVVAGRELLVGQLTRVKIADSAGGQHRAPRRRPFSQPPVAPGSRRDC